MESEGRHAGPNGNAGKEKPSKTWRIVWRVLDIPFIISFAFCVLMVVFCCFNLDKEWGPGGALIFGFFAVGCGIIMVAFWWLSCVKIKRRNNADGITTNHRMMNADSHYAPSAYPESRPAGMSGNATDTVAPDMQADGEDDLHNELETAKQLVEAIKPKVETVTGSYPAKTYVYDPKPILKIREGKPFTVTIVTRRITLRSKLTGGVWKTGMDDGNALAYKGRPFGVLFNGIANVHIRELLEHGATEVRLTAIRQGWYQPGYPEVYVMVPTMEEARAREQEEKGLREYEQREALGFMTGTSDHIFRIGETSWNAPEQVPNEGYASFIVTVDQLPTPEGSSAKPHIVLKDQNRIIAEINARSGATYLALAPLVGKRLKLLVQRYYSSYTVEANEI